MRCAISPENPFTLRMQHPGFAFGYERLRDNTRILDFGCHDGAFGAELRKHRRIEYFGVDKNRDALKRAPDGIVVKEFALPLPFADAEFDAVTMFEVLEHIADQDRVLREVFRVTKAGGLLLVSVPRRHVFTFLDMANFKFAFPTIHRFYYSLTRSREAWQQRYGANPNGLVGDVEQEKLWHQHFRDEEMRDLLERNGFRVVAMDGAGLFHQPMNFIGYVFRLKFLFTARVRYWDLRTFHSSSLLCAARKPSTDTAA